MAGHQEHALRENGIGARKEREDVFEPHRNVPRPRSGRLEAIDAHVQPSAARLRGLPEPREDLIAAAADAALRIVPRGQGLSRPAGDELFDRLAKRALVDVFPRDRSGQTRDSIRRALAGRRLLRIAADGLRNANRNLEKSGEKDRDREFDWPKSLC